MEVQNMSINDIKPYDNNPRNNDGAVDAVANSIKEFGWQQPIVVDKDMVIIVGHTRYKAAKKLGYKEVPVVVASNLNKEQVRAYRLADNKTGELANWVYGDLMSEIQEIQDLDLTDFGFNDSDLDISDKWEDNVSLDDYEEPDTSNFEPKKCICPKCGYLGNEEEFKV